LPELARSHCEKTSREGEHASSSKEREKNAVCAAICIRHQPVTGAIEGVFPGKRNAQTSICSNRERDYSGGGKEGCSTDPFPREWKERDGVFPRSMIRKKKDLKKGEVRPRRRTKRACIADFLHIASRILEGKKKKKFLIPWERKKGVKHPTITPEKK